jgi:LacI family transcriptional regulator
MLSLIDLGLTPGREVAVIGFDNIWEGAMYRPSLTTVGIGTRQLWEEVARLLLRIRSPEASSRGAGTRFNKRT